MHSLLQIVTEGVDVMRRFKSASTAGDSSGDAGSHIGTYIHALVESKGADMAKAAMRYNL